MRFPKALLFFYLLLNTFSTLLSLWIYSGYAKQSRRAAMWLFFLNCIVVLQAMNACVRLTIGHIANTPICRSSFARDCIWITVPFTKSSIVECIRSLAYVCSLLFFLYCFKKQTESGSLIGTGMLIMFYVGCKSTSQSVVLHNYRQPVHGCVFLHLVI